MKQFPAHLIFYVLLTHFLAWLGIYLKQVHNVDGAELIFLLPPFVLAFMFGFRDPNVRLGQSLRSFRLKHAWRWYLFALLVYPTTYLVATLVGEATGLVTTGNWQSYPTLVLLALPSAMLFAFFEEFAWRGYLEPLLLSRGFSGPTTSLIVGFIWVTWHIPLFAYGYYEIYSSAPLRSFLLFTVTLLLTAQVYGIMRRRSEVAWTSVLMHGVANAFVFPLVIGDQAIWTSYKLEWLILPTPASLLSAVLWLGVLLLTLQVLAKGRKTFHVYNSKRA